MDNSVNIIAKRSEKIRYRYVRYKDGAEMYGMCQKTFEKLAKEAKAIIKYGRLVLVDCDRVDECLELYRLE